jgi:hypothetical protein
VQLEIPDRREGGVIEEHMTKLPEGVVDLWEGGPTEGASWVFVGMFAAMSLGAVLAIAGIYWAEHVQARREAWAAEHPHEQVEPPCVPEQYQHVDRDRLDESDREVLDEIHKKREAAPDHDPAIGDLVTTFVDLVDNGQRVRDWVVARVVWPRETYVRARVVATGRAAAGLVSAQDTVDVPRETIATVIHLTGPAPVLPKPDQSRQAKARRRAKGQAKGRDKSPARPPEPVEHTPPKASEPQPQPSEPPEVDAQSMRAPEYADSEADNTPSLPPHGPGIASTQLSDRHLAWVAWWVKQQWPTRPHGPELAPERGDDITFMVGTPSSAAVPMIDLLVGRIHAVDGDTLDIEVLGNLGDHGFGEPKVGHGYMTGERIQMTRCLAISIIKPAPRLSAKSRHKRYRVRIGELIELSPDTIRELPPDSAWQPSRSDVAVRVVEQDSTRSVVALDGPAGEVNIALVTSTNGKPRTVCSWKFEIIALASRP